MPRTYESPAWVKERLAAKPNKAVGIFLQRKGQPLAVTRKIVIGKPAAPKPDPMAKARAALAAKRAAKKGESK